MQGWIISGLSYQDGLLNLINPYHDPHEGIVRALGGLIAPHDLLPCGTDGSAGWLGTTGGVGPAPGKRGGLWDHAMKGPL